jgi:GT2 family glycosyltransferase
MPEPALPPASVIIPSRNRPALLRDTVVSILAGEDVPAEIIMVDQSDAPNTELAALTTERPCRLRYAWSAERGVSRGRNHGVQLAAHAILVFADDDVLVSATWLAALVRALISAPPRSIITGQVVPQAVADPGRVKPAGKVDETPHTYTGRQPQDVLYAANVALYRAALEEVGPFDERLGPGTGFNGSEDSDLGYRLLRAGYAIRYVPEAVMYHRAWRTGEAFLPLRWNYGKGRGAYYAKHFGCPDGYTRWRLRRDLWLHLSSFPRNLLREPRRAWGDVVLSLGLLAGALGWWWTSRRPASPAA